MKELAVLDLALVPSGLVIMVAYHVWLLQIIIKHPAKTVVGIHAINRRLWVEAMMEDTKNGVLAVQSLRNNIMASTLLATTAILLSSVIAVLMTNQRGGSLLELAGLGDVSRMANSIKLFSILVCFLLAFLLHVQSIRYYSHASILINVPFKKICSPYLNVNYVASIVNRGGYFWSIGLRVFYLSFPLFLWTFGPIPMFCSCIALVFMFFFLDFTFEFRAHAHQQHTGNDVEQPN